MFSKEESKKIREEFWIDFGKNYPRKWVLYDTKMKEIQLKFTFDENGAQVSLDISSSDELIRDYYYDKMGSLQKILLTEYLPQVLFEKVYVLPEDKVISRIFIALIGVNVYRKDDWPRVQEFLNEKMNLMELFFLEYKDTIDS